MDEKIMTLHPQGKKGVNISRDKYYKIKFSIIESLKGKDLTHSDLVRSLKGHLKSDFDGSVGWYAETVKLDLEARGKIERFREGKMTFYRLLK